MVPAGLGLLAFTTSILQACSTISGYNEHVLQNPYWGDFGVSLVCSHYSLI